MALTTADIEKLFQTAKLRITGNPSLRDPQMDGHAAAAAFFKKGGTRAVDTFEKGIDSSPTLGG